MIDIATGEKCNRTTISVKEETKRNLFIAKYKLRMDTDELLIFLLKGAGLLTFEPTPPKPAAPIPASQVKDNDKMTFKEIVKNSSDTLETP